MTVEQFEKELLRNCMEIKALYDANGLISGFYLSIKEHIEYLKPRVEQRKKDLESE